MCGAVSVFVVLRRMSYIGHGLSHSVLGGVAVALALGVDLYIGAIVATAVSAVLIHRVARYRGLHTDAAIGIVTTGLFALGVLVVSTTRAGRVNTEALLFGNVLGVTRGDLVVLGVAATCFSALLFAFVKPLLLVTFDPDVAAAHGVRAGATEVLFNLLVAGVIVVSVRVLGVLLIAAAVVIPAAVARLVTSSLGQMFTIATGVGVTSAVVGLYTSYHVNAPSGATIVLTGVGLFLLTATAVTVFGGRRRPLRQRETALLTPLPPRVAPRHHKVDTGPAR
jgi:manganese/iron transport system permease protein/iron/zinc/copper transport system permease protein